MGYIGPNAEVRIDGIGEHGLAEISWEVSNEKSPVPHIGHKTAVGFTSGMFTVTWSGQAFARPDGSFGIDWDGWCRSDGDAGEKAGVFSTSGRKERLIGMVVDTVGNGYQREDGKWAKDISGKALDHSYE